MNVKLLFLKRIYESIHSLFLWFNFKLRTASVKNRSNWVLSKPKKKVIILERAEAKRYILYSQLLNRNMIIFYLYNNRHLYVIYSSKITFGYSIKIHNPIFHRDFLKCHTLLSLQTHLASSAIKHTELLF